MQPIAAGSRAAWFPGRDRPHDRVRMPRDKHPSPADRPSPYPRAGSEAVNAMVAETAPAILDLLKDGVPRSKPAIVEALAGHHRKGDVVHTLIRLTVTGRLIESAGKYTLGTTPGLDGADFPPRRVRPRQTRR